MQLEKVYQNHLLKWIKNVVDFEDPDHGNISKILLVV